jgi:glycosyltransferase involved in cell wall biosynthesis
MKNAKKILQFVCDGAPGGGTNHVLQLLNANWSDAESVLLTQQDSYLHQTAQSNGTTVFGGDFFRSRIDLSAVKRIREVISEVQPDLIHCHGGRAGFFQSFLSRDIPTVYTIHGFHHARKSLVGRSLGWAAERRTFRKMDRVLFVSHFDQQMAVNQGLLAHKQAHRVIHNGIRPLPPRTTSERLGVGFVGRFVFQKNPQLFLDVVERMPDVQFVMVGGGELDDEVKREIANRGIEDRVTLLGVLDHASTLEVISKLDVLLMTPRWEGLPLLPLEAMFMKVPVVSTATGGIPEVILHGETGLLSDSESAQQLADHVRLILDDEEFRTSLVKRAYEIANANFSQEVMLRSIKESYNQVFSCRDAAPASDLVRS